MWRLIDEVGEDETQVTGTAGEEEEEGETENVSLQ